MTKKNLKGGSRHKKMASKACKDYGRKKKFRIEKIKGECYARILKIFGGGMCDVFCNDGKTRMMVVRKKFTGRNKRDNFLKIDGMVMVALREWEVRSGGKKEKCDLIEVYNGSHMEDFKELKNLHKDLLPMSVKVEMGEDNPFDFTDEVSDTEEPEQSFKPEKIDNSKKEALPVTNKKISENKEHKVVEDDFDWDDI